MAKRKMAEAEAEAGVSANDQLADDLQQMSDATPEPGQPTEATPESPRGTHRPWAERYAPPEAKYRQFVDRDETRKKMIFFQFDLQPNQKTPNEDLLKVIQSHKKTEQGYPTGLKFTPNDRRFGACWKLPNTPEGRTTAALLIRDLDKLATRIEGAGQTVA